MDVSPKPVPHRVGSAHLVAIEYEKEGDIDRDMNSGCGISLKVCLGRHRE